MFHKKTTKQQPPMRSLTINPLLCSVQTCRSPDLRKGVQGKAGRSIRLLPNVPHLCIQMPRAGSSLPHSIFFIYLTNDSQPSVFTQCLLPFLSLFPCPMEPSVPEGSLFFFAGGDGDQLLGGFGNVVCTLDYLLGKQLVVHCTGR